MIKSNIGQVVRRFMFKETQLDDMTMNLINTLKERAKMKKVSDIVYNAITFLNWGVRVTMEGKRIGAFDESGKTLELFSMPILEAVRESVTGDDNKSVKKI